MAEKILTLNNVSTHPYGSAVGISDVNFSMKKGEVITLYGLFGSGKTTLLKAIVGLEPYTGEMIMNNIDDKVMSFSLNSLMKRCSVFANLEQPFKLRKIKGKEDLVLKKAKLYNLDEKINDRVSSLSVQEKFLVCIARAFIRDADLYLINNPLKFFKGEEREKAFEIIKKECKGKSVIYATDKIEEALSLGSKIGFMNALKFEQFGTIDNIYKTPNTKNVLASLGKYDFTLLKLQQENDVYFVEFENNKIIVKKPVNSIYVGQDVLVPIKDGNLSKDFYFDPESDFLISGR